VIKIGTFKLFSWKVRQGGGKRIEQQLKEIESINPDIIALQEMTISGISKYRDGLNKIGFKYVIDNFVLFPDSTDLVGPRRYGQLIACRWPLSNLEFLDIPWQERVLGAQIESPFGVIELYNAHIPPGSSNGWIKIDTFEGIYKALSNDSRNHRILCGDFNSPQVETIDGEIITWGQKLSKDQTWRISKGSERWDKGERNVLKGLSKYDLSDVFRSLYGYAKEDYSFYLKNRNRVFPRRFDHCIASESLNPKEFTYLHELREQKLSDHSAVEVVFKPEIINEI
jgi:exonuclease III